MVYSTVKVGVYPQFETYIYVGNTSLHVASKVFEDLVVIYFELVVDVILQGLIVIVKEVVVHAIPEISSRQHITVIV